jgi:hypothetical protein
MKKSNDGADQEGFTLRSSIKNLSLFDKVKMIIALIAAMLFLNAFFLIFLWSTLNSTQMLFLIILIGIYCIICFMISFIIQDEIYLDERAIYRRKKSMEAILFQDIMQVITWKHKRVNIMIQGKGRKVIECGFGFNEKEKEMLLKKLKEISIEYNFDIKENLSKMEYYDEIQNHYKISVNIEKKDTDYGIVSYSGGKKL